MPQIDLTVFMSVIETLFYIIILFYLVFMIFFSLNLFNSIKGNFYFILGNVLSLIILLSASPIKMLKIDLSLY
jgi:hypothetical protein